MKYEMTSPCAECPFLAKYARAYALRRLREFASGEFPCHKTAKADEDTGYVATPRSQHCAGALIFNECRGAPHQMARIAERLGLYDPAKLDMDAPVRAGGGREKRSRRDGP